VDTIEPEEVADAEEIRAGIQARRDQRRLRKRHRVFVAIALVVAALITLVAYRATSSDNHNGDNAAVNSGADDSSATDATDATDEPSTDETPPPTAAAGETDFQPTAGAVEWVATTAAAPAEAPRVTAPPGTRPCTAFQVSAKGSWQPTGGLMVGGVRFTNTSGSPCSLHGVPEVRLSDHAGKRLPISQQPSSGDDPGPALMPPGAEDANSIGIQWSNWCKPLSQPVKVQINLPDKGNVINVEPDGDGFKGAPDCTNKGVGSAMSIDPFQAAASPGAPTPATGLVATMRSPAAVVAGSTLRYEVTLKNPSSQPMPLDPCPSYREAVGAVEARFLLNCGPVGQIGPSASVVFSMQLDVPADTELGPTSLEWEAGGPATNAAITVTAS
jgi:hypothetical protein